MFKRTKVVIAELSGQKNAKGEKTHILYHERQTNGRSKLKRVIIIEKFAVNLKKAAEKITFPQSVTD